ncbi:hypothetical protein C8J56DRAFT_888190 [Mycena floridula]|nr:hypothetical protein C8J56DRAFT_888190 [Mycena floridula]
MERRRTLLLTATATTPERPRGVGTIGVKSAIVTRETERRIETGEENRDRRIGTASADLSACDPNLATDLSFWKTCLSHTTCQLRPYTKTEPPQAKLSRRVTGKIIIPLGRPPMWRSDLKIFNTQSHEIIWKKCVQVPHPNVQLPFEPEMDIDWVNDNIHHRLDPDSVLSLPELQLRLEAYIHCAAGNRPSLTGTLSGDHIHRVRLVFGLGNNFRNAGRFFLKCCNFDPGHWGTGCPDAFNGYLTEQLPAETFVRLDALRQEILSRPGGYWGFSESTEAPSQTYLKNLEIGGSMWLRHIHQVLPVPAFSPTDIRNWGMEYIPADSPLEWERRLERTIRRLAGTPPKIFAAWKLPMLDEMEPDKHYDMLQLCFGKQHQFIDTARCVSIFTLNTNAANGPHITAAGHGQKCQETRWKLGFTPGHVLPKSTGYLRSNLSRDAAFKGP